MHNMETFSEDQLKKKYKLNTTSNQTVFSPDQLKSKYGISEQTEQPETREGRIAQGLPVGMGDRVEPTFGGSIVRGVIKPFAKLAASIKGVGEAAQGKQPTGITSEYLGNVRPIGEGFDVTKGLTKENIKAVKDSVGTGVELGSYFPVARGIGIAKDVITQPFKQSAIQAVKSLGKEGLVQGGLQSAGTSMQEDQGFVKGAINTLGGMATGGVLGGVLGVGGVGLSRALTKTPASFTSKMVDKNIRNVFSGTTADINKIDDMAFKSRKGLELLVNESSNIQIPDLDAPLGSRTVKPFDITKAKPNEFLSAIDSLTVKAVNNAKTAVREAEQKGFNLDVNNAKSVITRAVNSGEIPVTTANRMLQQIDSTGGSPIKVFDWVQDVNQKYKNRFEKGTIDDMATSKLANDIAETLRKELNTITDRTGYAETMANINEMKRMLLAVAKKANKQINFGDITSEAGLDAGIALLTSNPAYMARTLASGIFKGIVNKVKNSSGMRNVKGAVSNIKKIPNTQKLPSTLLKQERKLLPAPKKGALRTQLESGKTINQPTRKVIDQGTEIVPRGNYLQTSLKNQGNTTTTMNKTNIANKTIMPSIISQTKAKIKPKNKQSLLQKIKNTPNKQGGFVQAYSGETDLTTKILKDLEGKTTVSKQYILDATNRGELKQVERDLIREMLATEKGDTINVSDFAKKVKAELLPLKAKSSINEGTKNWKGGAGGYENITLPDEIRGNVKQYKEHTWESPIKTSAGSTHPGLPRSDSYFGHTRIEDMADNKTRRVIEVQSDLYQKGGLEKETSQYALPKLPRNQTTSTNFIYDKIGYDMEKKGNPDFYIKKYKLTKDDLPSIKSQNKEFTDLMKKDDFIIEKSDEKLLKFQLDLIEKLKNIPSKNISRQNEIVKLQQYNDPTAHFRMIREEIKKAAQDGKTKLQFPTGETAMKIEGLGESNNFYARTGEFSRHKLTPSELKVGQKIETSTLSQDSWIITDVLGDGKFKAVPKDALEESLAIQDLKITDVPPEELHTFINTLGVDETFDISGKVDTNNPIYKFYEKDVQKYLNKFGGKRVVDDKGVSWIEVPITKEQGKTPVEAFGKMSLSPIGRSSKNEFKNLAKSPLGLGAIGSAGAVGTSKLLNTSSKETYQSSDKSTIDVPTRNVSVTKKDISELEPILFGELSNRSKDKQELEARIILNIALNRMAEFKKRGKDLTLEEVLKQKNQFQAYKGKEYNKYKTNDLLDIPTQKKKKVVKELTTKLLEEINQGKFKDNTNNAFFYVHNPDGTIAYNNKPLFKDN